MTITTYGRLYGALVLAGRWAISATDNPDKLPVVPAKYTQEALDYMDYSAHHDKEDPAITIENRVQILEENNEMYNDMFMQILGTEE